jgi:hypothetical protein
MNQLMEYNDEGIVDSTTVREVFHLETKAGEETKAGQGGA